MKPFLCLLAVLGVTACTEQVSTSFKASQPLNGVIEYSFP